MIDTTTGPGQLADQRLRDASIIWLTTVRADGQPQSVPVWFLWDGQTVLIYSKPDQPKVHNIRANPRVSLNLNSDDRGDTVTRLQGIARIDPDTPPATEVPGMIEKYREAIKRIGTTPEGFARDYSAAIRITPTRVTAF